MGHTDTFLLGNELGKRIQKLQSVLKEVQRKTAEINHILKSLNSKLTKAGIITKTDLSLDQIESEYVKYVILSTDGNYSEAARILKISAPTLYRKVAKMKERPARTRKKYQWNDSLIHNENNKRE